jgi:hypothetical protein
VRETFGLWEVFDHECGNGTQRSVAVLYAIYMGLEGEQPWRRLNARICGRWPKGLQRVKDLAHRILSGVANA